MQLNISENKLDLLLTCVSTRLDPCFEFAHDRNDESLVKEFIDTYELATEIEAQVGDFIDHNCLYSKAEMSAFYFTLKNRG